LKGLSLEAMDSYEFQDFVVDLFTRLGYSNIKVGSETAIRGVDLTMEKATNIGGTIKYMVQCEHQPRRAVSISTVKILHSTVVASPVLDKGLIVTSGRFSSTAIKYAEEVGIELIDAWKLIELSKTAGFAIQKEPQKKFEKCFPVSSKSQISLQVLNFLKNDLVGFDEKNTQIEELGLRLMPAYIVDYSINASFSTTVGEIYSVNKSGAMLLTETGDLVHPTVTNALLPQRYKLYTFTEETLGGVRVLEKGEFTTSFKDVKKIAKESLIKFYTKSVGYYGANGHYYNKLCVPKQKHVNVHDVNRLFIPFWNIVFSMLRYKYVLVGVEGAAGLTVLPSRMVAIPSDSGIKVYPQYCMISSREMKDGKFVCSDCGIITCDDESFKCKLCGRLVCREHTFFKRRYLIFKDKYCLTCAPKT
jgi:hypothetical protein